MATGRFTQGSEAEAPTRGAFYRDCRAVLGVVLLGLEIFLLRRLFTTDHLMGLESWWTKLLVLTRFGMPFSLCLLGGMGVASGRQWLAHYQGKSGATFVPRVNFAWLRWLCFHGLSYAACLACAAYLFQPEPDQQAWLGAAALGFGLSLASLVGSLLDLVLPLSGVLRLLWSLRIRIPLGLIGGLAAYGAGNRLLGDMPFWRPMGAGTMWLAYHLLGLVYPERILQPEYLRIGTPGFDVMISRYCSGYEGAFLFLGFFSLFLYLSRERLRFPRVYWLLPVGVLSVYLLNALRIALLIVVGTEFSDELAMEGFHVNAGWPFFGITAWLAVLVGIRSSYFSKVEWKRPSLDPQEKTVNLYGVYVTPIVVAIAAVMLSGSATRLAWVGDVTKLLGVAVVVFLYRHEYRSLFRSPSRSGLLFAVLGYGIWCLLFNGEPTARWEGEVLWPRMLGFVLATPLAEELVFRGFLMRRFAAADFEAVKVDQIGPWPVVFSSLLFGALHEQWLAGVACGLIFGLAYRWRGRLGDALVAHVLTNAALLFAALSTGNWGMVS